jgi:hypothetical protein
MTTTQETQPKRKVDSLAAGAAKDLLLNLDGNKRPTFDQIHELIDHLDENAKAGADADFDVDTNAWVVAEELLQPLHSPGLAPLFERFRLAWWMRGTRRELDGLNPRRIGRPTAAFNLALLRRGNDEHSSALRWTLLAFIDDVRMGQLKGGAREYLRSVMGVPKNDLDALQSLAAQSTVPPLSDAFTPTLEALPEFILTKFLCQTNTAQLFTMTGNRIEHELNPAFMDALIAKTDEKIGDKYAGTHLEFLAAYLMSLLPNYQPKISLQAAGSAHQSDVIARPLAHARPIVSDHVGSVLVECKNWDSRVGTPEVGYLNTRMIVTGCRLGIALSREGASHIRKSKDKDSDAAHTESAGEDLIRQVFNASGNLILDIDLARLRAMAAQNSVVSVLQDASTKFLFGWQTRATL